MALKICDRCFKTISNGEQTYQSGSVEYCQTCFQKIEEMLNTEKKKELGETRNAQLENEI